MGQYEDKASGQRAPDAGKDATHEPPKPGKATLVNTQCATPEAESAMSAARTDYEVSCAVAEMHCQDAIGDVIVELRTSAPKTDSELPIWLDAVRGWVTDLIGSRLANAWSKFRDKAEAMRPDNDGLDEMRGEKRMSAAEAATGIPIGDKAINVKPETIKGAIRSISTVGRSMVFHRRGVTENTNNRDAEFVESLRQLVASSFEWVRRKAPRVHSWDADQLRSAADVLSGPEHSPNAYKADVLRRLESYRASRVDEIGSGQEMYGKSKIHMTSISRADGAQRWAVVEFVEPNPDFPTKAIHDGRGGVKIVPSHTPKFISWPGEENAGTGIAYQKGRNKSADNPDGHVKAIEAFDPPTGDPEIDRWRAESTVGDKARGGAMASASEVPVP